MTQKDFLPWFYAFIAFVVIGFVGAAVLALFGIDSKIYKYSFAFVLSALISYAIFKKAKHPKDMLK